MHPRQHILGYRLVLSLLAGSIACGPTASPGLARPEGPSATGSAPNGSSTSSAESAADDELLSGSALPVDPDNDGRYTLGDLERSLTDYVSGHGSADQVNDLLAILYAGGQVEEDALLDVLVRFGYDPQGESGLRIAVRSSAATTPADAGSSDHDSRNSGLHQRYFSSQYNPTGPKHEAADSRNHDLYITRSWGHIESQSNNHHQLGGSGVHYDLNSAIWPGEHSSSRSGTYPSNHRRQTSASYPDGHDPSTSQRWPPNHHFDFSKGWNAPEHSTGVSRGWPPNHSTQSSDKHDDEHLVAVSSEYPMPHMKPSSRSHGFAISNSWPNYPEAHSTAASRVRPPNHFEQVSRSWPTDHKAVLSANWPPNHYDSVSKDWDKNDPGIHSTFWSSIFPPGHTYFTSVKDTVGIIKDIKETVGPKDAGH